ncbi:Clavaminate synthase-like protein [Backusella circina FSU 941]|nr:Clavaminate synthase-like protein [Backusella circina FSU 941]
MPTVQVKNSTQPDITYLPDRKNYEARVARRLNEEQLQKDLPDGFPEQLEGPKLWKGVDYQGKESEWVYELTEEELKEIDDAVHEFEATGKPFGEIQKDTFALPTLGPKITNLIQENVVDGRGFLVIRGINPDKYTREQNIIAYAGVSTFVGKRGLQGRHILAHIKDLVPQTGLDEIIAPAFTNDHQVYHTDAGDIISLFALGVAENGGKSRIASSWTVYNEIAKNRPDLIHTLSQDWPFEKNSVKGDQGYFLKPLLFHVDNKLIIQYARRNFTGFGKNPRREDIPPISEAQAEALDALHYTAEKYNLGVDFQKGDIQYINNLSIFHARDGYTDSEKNQRHLLRLWLHPDGAWKLPSQLESTWDTLYHKEREEEFPLEPTFRII